METVFTIVAQGDLLPTCVAYYNGWVAVAAREPKKDGVCGAWVVMAAYMPQPGSDMAHVLGHHDSTLPTDAEPTSLHISNDFVLAAALGSGGVRLYKLGVPLPPVPTMAVLIAELLPHPRPQLALQARWIGQASHARSLVVWCRVSFADRVVVYGHLPSCTGNETILSCSRGKIVAVDACKTGRAAILCSDWKLYTLAAGNDGRFNVKTLDLQTLAAPGRPPLLEPTALTVGDQLVVVGCACAMDASVAQDAKQTSAPLGLVEAFHFDSGRMALRREFPRKLPTALSTCGMRIVVGTSGRTADEPGCLYALIASCDKTLVFCAAERCHPAWPAGTVHLDKSVCCYAKRVSLPETGQLFTAAMLSKRATTNT